jgi:hypothetical protein
MTISAAGDPRVQPGEECRLSLCLGKTFSVDDNARGSASWVRTGTLSMCPDASRCEAKAERRLRYSELRWSSDGAIRSL